MKNEKLFFLKKSDILNGIKMFSFLADEYFLYSIFTIIGVCLVFLPHIMMNISSIGTDQNIKQVFQKPHFISFLQFSGQAFVIIVYFIKSCLYKYSFQQVVSTHHSFWSFFLKLSAISLFDIISTTLMYLSLAHMEIGTWQMLRGSMILFDYILYKIFYRKRTSSYQNAGIAICFIGILLVSSEYLISSSEVLYVRVLSFLLVLLAQFFQSCQSLIETKYLTDPSDPMEMIIGIEGIISAIFSLVVIFPIVGLISSKISFIFENIFDTLTMLKNNLTLIILALTYVFLVTCYLSLSTVIIEFTRTKDKSLLGCSRSLIILFFCPILHVINKSLGQSFDIYSLLYVPGSLLVLVGILIHDSVIKIGLFDYPLDSDSGNINYSKIIEEDSPLILQTTNSSIY